MKKVAVIAGLFLVLFLGSMMTAQAKTHYSFGFSFGVGPAIPYDYYSAYPSYYYSPYYYEAPYYRTYVVPRYRGGNRYRHSDRYYRDRRDGSRWDYRRDGRYNNRSRSNGRWRD